MLKVERFVNELMTSNCYVVYDDDKKKCIVIDPGSEKSLREIGFIEKHQLHLDYIIITHEHTDHNWGVNTLREHFPNTQLVCSDLCNKYVKKTNRAYFLYYYDDPDYKYVIDSADVLIKDDNGFLDWKGYKLRFVMTPGHSLGSMCIDIDGMLFTGDTIMPFPAYFNGRYSDEDEWNESIKKIIRTYNQETVIYPGHGESFLLGEWMTKYRL